MQSSCTFHVPQLKFAKELEIRNYEHLKNAYSKKLKIWAGSNKRIIFFTKIFGKLEIENYDKTQLNLLIMKRWKNLIQITNWYWKTENIENSNIYKKLKKLLFLKIEKYKQIESWSMHSSTFHLLWKEAALVAQCGLSFSFQYVPGPIYIPCHIKYMYYICGIYQLITFTFCTISGMRPPVIRTQYTFCRGTFCCSPKTCHLTSIGKRKMKSAQAARPE